MRRQALRAAAHADWAPEAPTYGVGEDHNVAITVSDGTVLRANVSGTAT